MPVTQINIRKLNESDASEMATLLNNKKVWDNLRNLVPFPYQLTDAVAFINLCQKEKPLQTFGIEYKRQFCGVIGLTPMREKNGREVEIGYWIGEPFWGRGIATRAVDLACRYAFEDLDVLSIYAGVYAYNQASMQVLRKNGFRQEGRFKEAIFKNNRVWDEYRFMKTMKST